MSFSPATIKEAKHLMRAIKAELKAGTRHFSASDGRELVTVPDILKELLARDVVELELPQGRAQPTYLRQLTPQKR